MAAPVATARATPGGIILKEGHGSRITFAADPDVSFEERAITPGGTEGGDKINITTLFNTSKKTYAPPALSEETDGSATVLYDPAVRTQIDALVNQPTTITITYHDGTTDACYGWLKSFIPNEMTSGAEPTAQVTFCFSSYDNSNNVEAGRTVVSVAGT